MEVDISALEHSVIPFSSSSSSSSPPSSSILLHPLLLSPYHDREHCRKRCLQLSAQCITQHAHSWLVWSIKSCVVFYTDLRSNLRPAKWNICCVLTAQLCFSLPVLDMKRSLKRLKMHSLLPLRNTVTSPMLNLYNMVQMRMWALRQTYYTLLSSGHSR